MLAIAGCIPRYVFCNSTRFDMKRIDHVITSCDLDKIEAVGKSNAELINATSSVVFTLYCQWNKF